MDYKYEELNYAQKIYEEGFQSENHKPTEMRLVATYMRRILGYKPKQLKDEMYKWSEENIPGYKRELYYPLINKAITQACKKGSMLINVESIDFYKFELDYILGLNIKDIETEEESKFAYDCKKLLFTLLFKMKTNKVITEKKSPEDDFEYKGKYFQGGNRQYSELKKLAVLSSKARINEDVINTLWNNGLVTPMYSGMIKLDFIEDIYKLQEDTNIESLLPVISVVNYESVGLYLDAYTGNNKVAFCEHCGKIFRKTSNRQKYCSDECYLETNRDLTRKRMMELRK